MTANFPAAPRQTEVSCSQCCKLYYIQSMNFGSFSVAPFPTFALKADQLYSSTTSGASWRLPVSMRWSGERRRLVTCCGVLLKGVTNWYGKVKYLDWNRAELEGFDLLCSHKNTQLHTWSLENYGQWQKCFSQEKLCFFNMELSSVTLLPCIVAFCLVKLELWTAVCWMWRMWMKMSSLSSLFFSTHHHSMIQPMQQNLSISKHCSLNCGQKDTHNTQGCSHQWGNRQRESDAGAAARWLLFW